MKPITHAHIAAKRYGGTPKDWFPYHNWFDQSKAAFPSMQHRLFLHSELGIEWFVQHFGHRIVIDDNIVPTHEIAHDHMLEDVGCVPTVESWLTHIPTINTCRIPNGLRPIREDRTQGAIARWGGTAADYEPIFQFLDSHSRHTDAARADILTHNRFALFILEGIIGPTIRIGGRDLASRTIGEDLVIARYGHIPFPSQISRFHLTAWMRGCDVPDALKLRE